jgi:Chlamydia polymorphic membrane protein (Chlamydia_PMP) repeat
MASSAHLGPLASRSRSRRGGTQLPSSGKSISQSISLLAIRFCPEVSFVIRILSSNPPAAICFLNIQPPATPTCLAEARQAETGQGETTLNYSMQFKRSVALQANALLLFLAAINATAQTKVVTDCSEADLRAAMAQGGTVTFACDGAITLTNTITNQWDTVLDGSGHDITIRGSNAVRVLYNSMNASLTLINVTIANGSSTDGAGIFNDGGQLTLSQVIFQNNTASSSDLYGVAPQGGGIFNAAGTVNATNCSFVGNAASVLYGYALSDRTSCGGAIQNAGGQLNLEDCAFTNNYVSGGGGVVAPTFLERIS